MDLTLVTASVGLHEAYSRYTSPGKVIAYVTPMGESIAENFYVGRRNRPYQDWKPIVQEFLESMIGMELKLSWRQDAGCSCGCSPGFHVRRVHPDGFDEPLRPRQIAQALEPQVGRHQRFTDRVFDPWKWSRGYDLDVYLGITADSYVVANRGMLATVTE